MEVKNVVPGTVEDNDLELPGLKPEVKEEVVEEKKEETPEPKPEEKKPVIPIDDPKALPDGVQKDDDLPEFLKPKPVEEKPKEEIAEEKPDLKPEEQDAAVFEVEKIEDKLDEKKEETPTLDYLALGTELGLEVKENSKEQLKEAYTKAIEDAKQRVVPDLSKFTDEQKLLFKWLEDPESSLKTFFEPLKIFDDFLATPDDEKVLAYLQNEDGLDEEAAQERLQQIIDNEQFDDYVEKIDESVYKARDNRFNALMGTITKAQADKEVKIRIEAEKEKQEMAKVVDDLNTFMGLEIPQNAKNAIKKKIEDGRIILENNNAKAQILGHYFMLWGDRALARLEQKAKDASDGGYGRGIDKGVSILHNTPPETDKPGGHREAKAEQVKPGQLPKMNDLDKDSFSGFQST